MAAPLETVDNRITGRARQPRQPGVVVVFSGGAPLVRVVPVDGPVRIGREPGDGGLALDDPRMSRAHCEIARDGKGWSVRDLASRNGTFVDGVRIAAPCTRSAPIVRIGETVALATDDVVPFLALDDLRLADR